MPVKLISRVPATATTAEVPEHYQPKNPTDWDDEDKEMVSLASKCKRLLIMALPNDIFMSLDHCVTSKELWGELLMQLEGGVASLRNNITMCIIEYHEFKANEGKSLKDTYSRFNILINKCKRSGVIRTNEDNNMLFLKSLGTEWLHLTMSMRTNLDLEIMSLADLYGSLASLEPQVLQLKSSIGGPLAFVAEGTKGKGEKKLTKERKKKKKALVTESEDEEDMSLEEEMSMTDIMKTLVSFTRDYRRGSAGRGRARDYDRGSYERKDFERKDWGEKEKRTEELRGEPHRDVEIWYRCGKPGHFVTWLHKSRLLHKGFHRSLKKMLPTSKAEFYNKKVLLAQTSELVTIESSRENEPHKGLVAFEEAGAETEFCGVANGDSDFTSSKTSEVSSYSEMNELYSEIIENFDSHQEEFNYLKEKLTLCKIEKNTLTEERTRFFQMYEKTKEERISLYNSSKEKIIQLEKTIKARDDEIKRLKNERTNVVSIKDFFQKETEFLHQDLDRELKIMKFQDAQNIFNKIRVNMGRRELGFFRI
ncbi:hypothetical protein OSB04_028405 [Centaurea solstitialis]|uniref:Uncharacterized protein n=1 Tax=Centaurea solstitialis TaxID=347529 RepID=A0AA38SH60_9ASTR|nr:hypothetical protein OSB04_028405 [Centaurea solstitialis]